MKQSVTIVAGLVLAVFAQQALAQVTFYSGEGFRGRAFTADREFSDFQPYGFNDRASSAIVQHGRWEVCEDAYFRGRCSIISSGQYPSLASLGLGRSISSVRRVPPNASAAYVPPPPRAPVYAYYPRQGERLYSANVTRGSRSRRSAGTALLGGAQRRSPAARPTSPVRSSAASSAACSVTRSAAAGARTWPPRSAPWVALPWAPTWAAARAIRRTCSAARPCPAPPARLLGCHLRLPGPRIPRATRERTGTYHSRERPRRAADVSAVADARMR